MPNSQVWGNAQGNQVEEQDLVTKINPDEGDQAIIRVNDVNNNDADRAAIYAKNSNTGASARALYTEGQVEMVAGLTGNPEVTGVKIYNASTDEGAIALHVHGKGNVTAHITSLNSITKKALNVEGDTHLESYTPDNLAHNTLEVVNENANVDGRALKVEGKTELDGDTIISGELQVGDELQATGTVHVGAVGVAGEIDSGGTELSPTDLKIGTDNVTADVELSHAGQYTKTGGSLLVGKKQEDGDLGELNRIDSNAIVQMPRPLYIGTLTRTNGLRLSRTGAPILCKGPLHGEENLLLGDSGVDGRIDCNASELDNRDLLIGTQASTADMVLGRDGQNLTVNSALIVGGAAAAVAKIDAELDGASARKLKIGTQNSTDNITVGRSGKTTHVDGAINVGQTAFVVGETSLAGNLKVGPTANAGTINSGGVAPAPLNLEVGTGAGTASVVMSRAGQTIDMFGQERLNSNACVLNGAANITAANGIGFVVNAAGHGNGSSIDFYINGQVQGWLDTTGFVNA